MIPFYYKFKSMSEISSDLIKFSKSSTKWFESNGFDVLTVPNEIAFKDKIIKDLIVRFNAKPAILKMPAMAMYNWHVDNKRLSALNILLEGFNSVTLFGKPLENNIQIVSFTELVYNPGEMYLINTQELHAVYNKDNIRTVFSLGFQEPHSFYSVKEYVSGL